MRKSPDDAASQGMRITHGMMRNWWAAAALGTQGADPTLTIMSRTRRGGSGRACVEEVTWFAQSETEQSLPLRF